MSENLTGDSDGAAPNWQMLTTQWGLVVSACHDESSEGMAALNRLCRIYWYPIYAHVRRQGRSAEDAQDLTQEFFARLLKKQYFKLADPARGRFRTFLLSALGNFVINEWEKSRTLKRGAGQITIPLEAKDGEERYQHEAADGLSPDKIYERRWAATLLESVVDRLRKEYIAVGKESLFEGLKASVWGEGPEDGYQSLACKIQLSEGALRVAAHRMRERYRILLREAVAETVTAPEDVEDELRYLISVLRQ